MEQPQDEQTRIQVRDALRRRVNDSALDIRWNPESYLTSPGRFDCYGLPIPAKREGRWEVIRRLEATGDVVLVWQVRDMETEAYRPLGEWVLDFMVKWDRANQHWMHEQQQLFDAAEREREAEQAALEEETLEDFWRYGVDVLGMKEDRGVGIGESPRFRRATPTAGAT